MSLARGGDFSDEIGAYETNLARIRQNVRDRNERARKEAEALADQQRLANGKEKRVFELNLDPDYWRPRFLFPYSLDTTPMRLPPPSQMDTYDFARYGFTGGPSA